VRREGDQSENVRKETDRQEGGKMSEPSPQGHEGQAHGWKDGMMPTRNKSTI
jgi:hypothetical protein